MTAQTGFADLVQLFQYQASVRSDKVGLVFGNRETTFGELDQKANRVANGLRAIAPASQTRVALLDKNSDVFYEVLLGAAKAGHVLAPVNWRLAPAEVAYIVNDAAAQVLFVGEEFFPIIAQIRPELRSVRRIIALSGSHPQWERYEAWRDCQRCVAPEVRIEGDDDVLQLYTSGTTGQPKGALITHNNVLAQFAVAHEWYPCTADDVSLACLPQYHIGGSNLGLIGLYTGARTVIAREAIPADLFRLIETEQVTLTFIVPALILFMLQTPGCEAVDFSSLKQIDYGASPIALDLLRQALTTFKCAFGQLYGLTESTGVVTHLPPEDHDASGGPRMRSCGKPISNAEVRVIGADGADLPTGAVGEIVVRSPQVFKGYWNLPEASASAMRDGWLHTGDAGYFDADGFLYVHDRVKDMIVSGGENIYPAEVENALYGHPSVADVAVIGIPDSRWGEAVKAVVVLKPGVPPATEADLIAYCRKRIAHYKAPKSIDFAESLPRNASGKLLKRVLRAPYWEGRERHVN